MVGKALLLDVWQGRSVIYGKNKITNEIISAMKSAGYDVRETDPFNDIIPYQWKATGYRPK